MIHLDMHEVPPTPGNILHRADLVRRRQPLKYLVIDPYLFVEAQSGKGETETQSIKSMLTRFQSWGRENHIWVIIVAHPRSLKKIDGKNAMEDINMYTISGSANWANLADFILSITRINEPDRTFTRLDVLKVRDQELCRTGTVYYTTPASPADVMKSMRAKRNVVVTMVNPYGDVASHIRLCEAIHTYA